MGVTVFHSLTATTPDNTQYEIRPSHWNTNHVASLSLAGSDLSNAFSNSPTVTFGTSGGLMTASVNTAYVALSNSSSIMPVASSTNFLGTAASGSFIATSVSSSIMPIASSSNFLGTAASGSFIATSNSSLFQQTSATSAITSAAFPSAQTTKFAGTGTTFAGTNISATIGLNSNGLALSLSGNTGGGGGGGIAAAAGSQTQTSGTVLFSNSNGITFGMSNSSVITASHNGLTTAMQSNAGSNFLGTNTALTANGVSVTANSSGLSLNFPAFLTSQSNQAFSASGGSSTFQTLNFANSNGVTFSNSGGSVIASVPGTSSISATGIVSISTNGNTISIGAPAMSVGLSNLGNTSGNTGTVSNQFVLAGGNNITLSGSTNAAGMTVTVSANTAAAANLSVSAGTTSGAFGGITFANSNNVTFGLNNGTITASAPSGGGGGVAIANSQTTYTSGTVSFRDGNGITFASGTGQGVSLTHGLQFTSATSAITASALNTSQSSLFQHTSATSAITSAAFPSAQTTKFAGTGTTFSGTNVSGSITLNSNGLNLALSAPAAAGAQTGISSIALSGTTYTNGSVSFRDGNNISFSSGTGNAISITHNLQSAGAYLTTAMQSQSSSVFARTGFTSTTTAGTALVGTLNTNGLSLGIPTIITNALTTAMQSNASTAFAGTGSAFTNLTATFNTAGLSISAPATSSISATGAVSISTNGNTISIGAPAFSAGVTTLGNTLGNTGTVSNQLVLAGGNNITLSGSTNAGGMTLTISGPNVGGAQTGISGLVVSNTTYTSGTVSFRDGNGITFASGTGQGVSLTHGLQFTSNTSAITASALNTSQSSLFQHTSATSAITSAAFPSAQTTKFAGTGTTFSGTNVSGSITLNSNGLNLALSAPAAAGAQTAISGLVVSNTTYTSGTVSFRDGNGITFASGTGQGLSITHGLQFTSATSAITSNALNTSQSSVFFQTSQSSVFLQTSQSSLFQHTSATSAITSAAFPSAQTTKFAGTGTTFSGTNVSGSITLNSNGLNLALSAGGGGGGGVVFANSQTTYTSGTVSLREGGGAITIASNTGQRIDISVPAVSSIYGTNGILISSAGSSISIQNDYNKTWEVIPALSGAVVYSTASANTLVFMPLYPQDNYTFSGVQMLGSMQSNTATNASYAASHTISYALYSVNQTATTMSRLGSSSLAIILTASSNARGAFTISYDGASSVTSSSLGVGLFSALNAQKYMNLLFASSLQDGGAYALGVAYSSASTNAAPLSAVSFNMVRFLSNISGFGILDGTSAAGIVNSYLPDGVPFVYSVTSGGWPSTIPFSDRRQVPTYQFPYVMFRGT